jgi:hypothetical protein
MNISQAPKTAGSRAVMAAIVAAGGQYSVELESRRHRQRRIRAWLDDPARSVVVAEPSGATVSDYVWRQLAPLGVTPAGETVTVG